jgi:uncharacterized protein YcgL (UPF0745 family)
MIAFVYKSARRDDAYVYLRERDAFGVLPAPLLAQLGALAFVVVVELGPGRTLARAAADVVRAALQANGFYLQMPPPPDGSAALTPR